MAATANMILKITTLADVAGLKAGLDMVAAFGGKVLEVMKAVDDFSDAHSRLSLDVSKMVSATKGMIAAQDAYVVANKLSAAGIKATAEQLEGLGKKATEYAQATGQDIPAALQQMTQAVITGSARGLKPFGVDVSEAKDKLDAANMAMNQFAKEMAGITVQVDSLTDMIDALNTNIGDAAKRMAELSGASAAVVGPLQELNNALTYFNEMMEVAPNAMMKFTTNLKGLGAEVGRSFLDLISNVLAPLEVIVGVISAPIIALAEAVGLGDINPISALRSALELAKEKLSALGAGAVSQLAYDVQLETAGKNATGKTAVGDALGAAAGGAYAESVASAKSAIKPAKKRGGGGGGGRKKTQDSRGGGDIYDAASANVDAMMAAGGEYDQGLINELTGIDLPQTVAERTQMILEATKEVLEAKAFALEEMRLDLEVEEGSASEMLSMNVEERLLQLQEQKRQREMERAVEGDPRVKAEMDALAREEELAYYEKSINFAGEYGAAWDSALSRTSAGAMAASAAHQVLRGTVTMVAQAIVGSSKMSVKAVMEMLKGIGLAVGIESTLQGLMELVRAAVDFAKPFGIGAANGAAHLAAAAEAFVVAAIGYAVAGGATAISKSAGGGGGMSRSSSGGGGGGGSPGYEGSGGGEKQVVVNVTLHGDAAGVFRIVDDENERRSRNGQPTIKSAA